MNDLSNQRNKAIIFGSLALLTLGSLLYVTMLRKPEGSSKPAKDPKSRQVVKEKSSKIPQKKETTKDEGLRHDDVPQAKATVTLEEAGMETETMATGPVKQSTTEEDRIEADTLIATAIATATTDDNTDSYTTSLGSTDSTLQEDNLEEKSPLLTAAPSTSTSSDISSSRLSQQQDAINLPPPASSTNNSSTTSNSNSSNINGPGLNGYWQPPSTNTTFQHSMGWPELFTLQQQDDDPAKQVSNGTIPTTAPAPAKTNGEKKKHSKKRMTRLEQIDQQRQTHIVTMKARCNWWPNCTNKNCKYHHPYKPCRYGDLCLYNERCMFLHSWDYEEPIRQAKQQHQYQFQS